MVKVSSIVSSMVVTDFERTVGLDVSVPTYPLKDGIHRVAPLTTANNLVGKLHKQFPNLRVLIVKFPHGSL